MTCKVRTGKQDIPFLFLVIDNCSHFSSDELIKPRQRYKKYSFCSSYWIKKCWFYSIRRTEWIKSVLLFLIFQLLLSSSTFAIVLIVLRFLNITLYAQCLFGRMCQKSVALHWIYVSESVSFRCYHVSKSVMIWLFHVSESVKIWRER